MFLIKYGIYGDNIIDYFCTYTFTHIYPNLNSYIENQSHFYVGPQRRSCRFWSFSGDACSVVNCARAATGDLGRMEKTTHLGLGQSSTGPPGGHWIYADAGQASGPR